MSTHQGLGHARRNMLRLILWINHADSIMLKQILWISISAAGWSQRIKIGFQKLYLRLLFGTVNSK
jgi:hypothetical protein